MVKCGNVVARENGRRVFDFEYRGTYLYNTLAIGVRGMEIKRQDLVFPVHYCTDSNRGVNVQMHG